MTIKGQKVWKQACRAELLGVCLCATDTVYGNLKAKAKGQRIHVWCGACGTTWVRVVLGQENKTETEGVSV